jgi:hypothetical protein
LKPKFQDHRERFLHDSPAMVSGKEFIPNLRFIFSGREVPQADGPD